MRELSNAPKIIFIGFNDKPIDLSQALQKKINTLSASELALSNYFKALYNVGEAKQ